MPLEKDTFRHVSDFARYCRSGEALPPNAVRSDRAPTYKRLVRNIIGDCLRRAYPICVSILSAQDWDNLVSDFMSNWNCPSPQLWKMPRELCDFVRSSAYAQKLGRPYLDDLLYFEWIEIEVFMMPDVSALVEKTDGDLFMEKIVLNQEYRLIELSYPVFRVPADQLELHKGTYFLLAFRHPKTLKVCFMELSELWAEVLELLSARALAGHELLSLLSAELDSEQSAAITKMLSAFLDNLNKAGMIRGFR